MTIYKIWINFINILFMYKYPSIFIFYIYQNCLFFSSLFFSRFFLRNPGALENRDFSAKVSWFIYLFIFITNYVFCLKSLIKKKTKEY